MKALDFVLALLAAIVGALLPAGSASTLELFTLGRGRYFGWMSGEMNLGTERAARGDKRNGETQQMAL